MEALAAAAFSTAPQTRVSHIRSSQPAANPATSAQQATRSLQHADLQHSAVQPAASQESLASVQSTQSSLAPRLQTDRSDLTMYTDFTSPASSALQRPFETYVPSRPDAARVRTPEDAIQHAHTTEDMSATSPMSITSPVTMNGTKRTASGHVKSAPSLPSTPFTTGTAFTGKHSRTNSLSSTSSRAGDLAMTLKSRLGYAMAKVQHGWEHKDITEVEHLAVHKMSPNRHSMSHVDHRQRPLSSGLTNGTANLSMYSGYDDPYTDGRPPSKRHSGVFNYMPSSSQPSIGTVPRLQPAADIRPQSSQIHRHYHTAPSSQTEPYYSTNMMSPPRTPVNGILHRPPTIRTQVQTEEAERDALQALFQLGSPHTSQMPQYPNASQASSSQASPLRSEFATPRRVTFARSESDTSVRQLSEDGLSEANAQERQVEVS